MVSNHRLRSRSPCLVLILTPIRVSTRSCEITRPGSKLSETPYSMRKEEWLVSTIAQEKMSPSRLVFVVSLDASDLKKPPGLAHMLLPRFRGPFKILERPSPLNYRLDLPPNSRAHDVFHVEKLLPAYDRDRNLFPTSDGPIPDDDPVTDDLGDYYEEQYKVE
ncbi:hypothetical protein BGZ82_005198, partial [Podila clonocystis]